jgi:uncharacterized membrane protein YfcA
MTNLIIVGFFILLVAVAMTMVGKGGGNFYVVILAWSGITMHEAATAGQFILLFASIAAMTIFQKNRSISWPLALIVGTLMALSALAGGYFSHFFSGFSLKLIFAVMLVISGTLLLVPVSEKNGAAKGRRFGVIALRSGDRTFGIDLRIVLPVTILAGFGAGMVGVSGGSFLVPLMVVACGVPMHTAVGTASVMIAATAFMGFTGHAIHGDFNPSWAVPLAAVTVIGGIVGAKLALHSRPIHLKKLFAFTNWLAALFMLINAFHSIGTI